MTDPLLEARLDALEHQLELALDLEWLQDLPRSKNLRRDFWTGLDGSIALSARQLMGDVAKIREQLKGLDTSTAAPAKELWDNYVKAYAQSHELFTEFLEVIGGLVFQQSSQGGAVLYVADEIVRKCSEETLPTESWRSITVPSRHQAVKSTLARLVRLRFPEQTIWTLPLVTHDFGFVVMEQQPALKGFLEDCAKGWAKGKVLGRKAMDRDTAGRHVVNFASDIFATLYTGPAYACAAIMLAFDLGAPEARAPVSPNASRVHVILETLRGMSVPVGAAAGMFDPVIERLQVAWERAEQYVDNKALDENDKDRLNDLVKGLREKLEYQLLATTAYPDSRPGWLTATEWFQHWNRQLKAGEELTVPGPVGQLSQLRDALNAVWLFRLLHEHPAPGDAVQAEPCFSIRSVDKPALELCQTIIREQLPPAPGTETDRPPLGHLR